MRFHFPNLLWFPNITAGGWAGSQISLGREKEDWVERAGEGLHRAPRSVCQALGRNILGKGVQEVRRWMRTSPLNSRSPSMSLQGLWTSYAKLRMCVCVGLHTFVQSVHSFRQNLKGPHYPKQVGSNPSLYRWRNLVEWMRNEWAV